MLITRRESRKKEIGYDGRLHFKELIRQKKKRHRFIDSLLDSVGEGEGGLFQENSIETCILSRVKQITSPGWMHETSTRTWCTRKT